MPPSHPTVDLAAALLLAISLPISLLAGWRGYASLRRSGFPVSRVPDLPLGLGEACCFFLLLAGLMLVAGPLIYPGAVLLVVGLLRMRKTDLQALWNLERRDWTRAPRTAAGLYLSILPAIGLLLLVSVAVGQHFGWPMESQKPVQMFLEAKSPTVILGILLMACVAAPIAEEILFRGFLYPWIKCRAGRTVALALTSVLFGLAHLHWSSFLSLTLFGLVLNLVYDFTGKIAHSIALHALFNTTTCAFLLLYKFTAHPA